MLLILASCGAVRASTFPYNASHASEDFGMRNPLAVEALFTVNGGHNELTITLENSEGNPTGVDEILDILAFQFRRQNFNQGGFTTETYCADVTSTGCSSYTTEWTESLPNDYSAKVAEFMFAFPRVEADVAPDEGNAPEPSTLILTGAAWAAGLLAFRYRKVTKRD